MNTAIAEIQNAPTFDGLKARIISFLGHGVEPSKVALAVGCEPSYISQLLADEQFSAAVSARRLEQLQEATDRDSRLNSIEDKLIERTEQLVSSPLAFSRPMDAIRALATVNAMKRRGAGNDMTASQHTTIVQLNLPAVATNRFALEDFTVDVNNQVIKTGDQVLVTIPSNNVQQLAERILPSKQEQKTLGVKYGKAKITVDDLK